MKKITSFAFAVLAATPMFAEVPQLEIVKEPMKLTSRARTSNQMYTPSESARKVQDNAAITDVVTYTSSKALYLGLSPQGYAWLKPFGFTSALGTVEFSPIFKSESYDWSWENFLDADQSEIVTSSETVLSIDVDPSMVFAGPTLKCSVAGAEYLYNDSVVEYYPGKTPAYMGLSHPADPSGTALVSPIVYTEGVISNIVPCIDYTDYSKIPGAEDMAGTFNPETGCWVDLASAIKLTEPLTDIKITAYGSVLPGLSAPYTLKGGSIYVQAENSEQQEVAIAVFPINDNKIDFTDTIGVGSFTIPVDETGFFNGFTTFEVHAQNELGLNTGDPVIVPTDGVYISIYGVNDKEKFTSFNLCYSKREYSTAALNDKVYYTSMEYSNKLNAYLEVEGINENGETVSALSYNTGLFYTSSTMVSVMVSREYSIFYDIEIPFILNATKGYEKDDMKIEVPVEGGQDNQEGRWLFANNDINQLIEDGYVSIEEENADWFDYGLIPDEDEPQYFFLAVEAQPLPEGVAGRKGTLTFTGYGYDTTITIIQGTPASINDVVAAQAKNGKVYDLQGRVVTKATKGIYIVDGKKVIL